MATIDQLKNKEELIWLNDQWQSVPLKFSINNKYGFYHMKAAQFRFMRFLPFFVNAFPETAPRKGVIESQLIPIPKMQEAMNEAGANISGRVFLKDDAHLPIAGSVKARGGIHEVLRIAESLGQKSEMLYPTDDYSKLNSEEYRNFYGQYTIQVGSTGNLGLSIGRTAARLGFKVIVHMSSDAKEWKKNLLRSEGVTVKEYDGDYSEAVATGRKESAEDPMSFFVDDENSEDLFFGYSTAAMRLAIQLRKAYIPVDEKHPLFVYIPCGVGGAPGGITFGLRQLYGDNVHCFFAEPVAAPCVTLSLATGKGSDIAVKDIGLDGKTIADGLAVGRASQFVCDMMEPLVSGCFTVADERLPKYQAQLKELENIHLEPSACAGFYGLSQIEQAGNAFEDYLVKHNLKDAMPEATHIVWGTGGGLQEKYDPEIQ